jgi:hypothetical protein
MKFRVSKMQESFFYMHDHDFPSVNSAPRICSLKLVLEIPYWQKVILIFHKAPQVQFEGVRSGDLGHQKCAPMVEIPFSKLPVQEWYRLVAVCWRCRVASIPVTTKNLTIGEY